MKPHEALAPRGKVVLDANRILQNNAAMLNAIRKPGLVRTGTYRIYQGVLAPEEGQTTRCPAPP